MIRVTVPRQAAAALMDGSLRLLAVEGEPECSLGYECDDTTHDGRCGEPRPDPDIVQAIEAGERIGIDVECERCDGSGTVRGGYPDYEALDCPHDCTGGRVSVGSVRPVRVLPIRTVLAPYDGEELTIAYGRQVWHGVTNITADLAVYGPAESLIGKFAVEVEDARREP